MARKKATAPVRKATGGKAPRKFLKASQRGDLLDRREGRKSPYKAARKGSDGMFYICVDDLIYVSLIFVCSYFSIA